ncbi:hypothetical protein LU631_22085 [Erwinia tracheiphila]|uniref:hypothetical protein n=1 Tax=Erwinia tracheiphila TaxID=65700 RepID=UPI00033CF8BE|nr:hypothetical protein [Erwinia tracheiphila]EOS94880.1 hypothetical protein ETR_11337 [Erwinia tracheiphila PSU-1]UIA87371.1 hypothetical protein LU631_22085 [Erwinia tracheiphila]UIA95735.1 hypothetical protein LU633_20530 [Erwinia tracheiphila]
MPGNALEYPTKLDTVNQSLEQLLNGGAKIVSSYGLALTLTHKKKSVLCLVKGAGDGTVQNVATSRCYALN